MRLRIRGGKTTLAAALFLLTAVPMAAVVTPERSGVGERLFLHPDLGIRSALLRPAELPAAAAAAAAADLAVLRAPAGAARLDARGGRWATLTPVQPLLPGRGNQLRWEDLGRTPPADEGALRGAVVELFAGYLRANAAPLRVDPGEAVLAKVTLHRGGAVAQIHVSRVVGGVPVRDSYLSAVVNHGNISLIGTHRWGDVDLPTTPTVSEEAARAVVQAHVEPFAILGAWGASELVIVPMAAGQNLSEIALGAGYGHRLAWTLRPSFADEPGRWEALVDAHSGELLSFFDTTHYVATERRVEGGVLPVTNDGVVPDGVEQPGWPMPFDNVSTPSGTVTTDSGGNLPNPVDGTITSNLSGQFVTINDNCGPISLSSTGDVDFGTSGGTDCVTPGFGGAGNTHASRSGFHELNRIREMAVGQLPTNPWLQQLLTANMNINNTCNATYNGQVNFYRSGGGCSNTGEIAGVFDHEWGHGMDDNDATPGVSSPGEGIADIYAALRLNTSCIGRNFRPGVNCGGYGDACTDCTGVRDIDYGKHASGQPHDVTWQKTACSFGGTSFCFFFPHCPGLVYGEAVWDLVHRDLPNLYGMGFNTANEVGTYLTYVGAGGVGTWYDCTDSTGFGGCGPGSGYLEYLAADDDDGNLNNGTPHMQAIYAAFDRHEIACDTPTVVDSGCAGTPTVAPAVSGTPADRGANLSWGAVAGASKYQVFRTDGVFGCDFGKIRVGETTGTSFSDSGLQNGREYYYTVIPTAGPDICMGPASACTTVVPAGGPACTVDADCDDGAYCNGAETCNTGTGQCEAGTPPSCDDGVFCNGTETCNESTDSCDPGTPPDCDDGVGCTDDSCNAVTDSCDNVANDANCDNGLFCDGAETCDAVADCQSGSDPCPGQSCDEATDQCVGCTVDADCDDGAFCNGAETCNTGTGQCEAGTPPSCDDGAFCNGTETCNEATDSCDPGTAPNCNDGVGCTDDSCNEGTDQCDNVPNDANCPDDGMFCNGTEFCNAVTDCSSTGNPCAPNQSCNEADDICEDSCKPKKASCSADSECCSGKCKGRAGRKTCK